MAQIGWYAFQLALTAVLVLMLWRSGFVFGDNATPVSNGAIMVFGFVWAATIYLRAVLDWWWSPAQPRTRSERNAEADAYWQSVAMRRALRRSKRNGATD